MKFCYDTEFIEDGSTIDLVSIGIVSEDGRFFYRQNLNANFAKASDWVIRNMLSKLEHYDMHGKRSCTPATAPGGSIGLESHLSRCSDANCPWRSKTEIARELLDFVDMPKHGKPEFIAYYADYDWVSLCQLYGTMMDLPKGFPMWSFDLKQWCVQLGDPDLPRFITDAEQHHALHDAREVRQRYAWLQNRGGDIGT